MLAGTLVLYRLKLVSVNPLQSVRHNTTRKDNEACLERRFPGVGLFESPTDLQLRNPSPTRRAPRAPSCSRSYTYVTATGADEHVTPSQASAHGSPDAHPVSAAGRPVAVHRFTSAARSLADTLAARQRQLLLTAIPTSANSRRRNNSTC